MLILNSKIITWLKPNTILEGQAILVTGSVIKEIDDQKSLIEKYPAEEKLDAKGQYLMPGLICAHTHFYGAFSRGMNIPGPAPADFPQILNKLWWPLDESLTLEDVEYSALVCMIDAIRHGTTTLFDHHASPNAISGSLTSIQRAYSKSGLRGLICYEVTDRGGKEKRDEGIQENISKINELKPLKGNRVKAIFGMHAGLTLTDESLEKCRSALANETGIHIHVAEHPVDEYDSLNKSGKRVVERLEQFGFLGDKSILVHGVHLDINEIELIQKTGTWLTHQPRSNMNNGVGLGDVENMLQAGVKVCIGNDGFSNAMWDEWRTCYLVHKLWNLDPRKMNGNSVVQMGAYNNSEITSHFFDNNKIGTIEIGAKADLILVDYQPFTDLTTDNLPWHIAFGFRDSMVTTTIVEGEILMKDRVLTTLNEAEITKHAMQLSKQVWNRYNENMKHRG
jgi:putative selenium metabolism protein SsnA